MTGIGIIVFLFLTEKQNNLLLLYLSIGYNLFQVFAPSVWAKLSLFALRRAGAAKFSGCQKARGNVCKGREQVWLRRA